MENGLAEKKYALWILKIKGPQPLTVLAEKMNMTTEGARFQLLKLAEKGLVKATTESKGRGRPQQIWSLTQSGHDRFPDTHAKLLTKLIKAIRDTLGEESLEAIIEAKGKSSVGEYLDELKEQIDLEGRVARLAEIRTREGYMAEYKKEDDGYLLIENHCPICLAAKTCQQFCESEFKTFQSVLGDNVTIERVDHLLAGARRCAYRITPVV